ncbi:hypothetical protein DFP72DRAFT_1082689 [Ephemerocybe angulata]|uniref:Uncharacterized protein n=1 Tax=Ephemerocybe angulata TaxID=980116 RepID=A0A8H6LSG2_9AGAR|nr:hypothetical protein DFP72DRAFT_1082689 [Tulosesus angulatus]
MAHIPRSAKFSSKWIAGDLFAYNIHIKSTPSANFFLPDCADPSLDSLDPGILTSPTANNPTLSNATEAYLGYVDLAHCATQESVIDGVSAETLKVAHFQE